MAILDEYTRECLAMDVARRMSHRDVMDRLAEGEGSFPMKRIWLLSYPIFLLPFLCAQPSLAQDPAFMNLPEGAKARLGTGWFHGEIAYSPDGTRLAVTGSVGVWLYDTHTWNEVALITGHFQSDFGPLIFSPDGQTLAGASSAGISLLDVPTGRYKASFSPTRRGGVGWIKCLAFSPDGAIIAAGYGYDDDNDPDDPEDFFVNLWDVDSGKQRVTWEHKWPVYSVAFSPDGNTLASGSGGGTVRLWDVPTGQHKTSIEFSPISVRPLAFSPDGTTLAIGCGDGMVRLWDVTTGQLKLRRLPHGNAVEFVRYSPDGTTLASADGDGNIKLWDALTYREKSSPKGTSGRMRSLAFSPDGTTLASGGYEDKTVRLWDVTTGQPKNSLEKRDGSVRSVAFSPDGNTLASGSGDSKVRLWDAKTGRLRATLEGHTGSVNSVAFSPDGTTLASGAYDDETVRLWHVATGQLRFTLYGHGESVPFVAFSPDGTTLVSAGDSGNHSNPSPVHLWNARTNRLRTTLEATPRRGVRILAFSPDGTTLAGGGSDPKVWLWDAKTGRLRATYETGSPFRWVESLAFSPDGHTLATIKSWNQFELWDAGNPYGPDGSDYLRLRATIKVVKVGHGKQTDYVGMAYSPDGEFLALGGGDKVCHLWDVSGGKLRASLIGPYPLYANYSPLYTSYYFFSVAFSPDGNTLVTANTNGTILLWDMSPFITRPTYISAINSKVLEVPAGSALYEPFIVEVRDQVGSPLAGAQVTFTVTSGGGTLSTEAVTTDSSGHASTILTLGSMPGTNTVTATVGYLEPVTFTAVGIAVPRTLRIVSGGDQQGPVGIPLGFPFVVLVLDQNGEPIPGAVVTFAVTAGDGTLSLETATTDSFGLASSTLTLGSGPGTNTVEVTVADQEAVTFSALALATPDFNGDGVINFADFFLFADAFGTTDARFDLDGSGVVDFGDFFIFSDAFGQPARAKLLALAAKLIGLPEGPQLRQNMPNPFNSQTVISYFLLAPGPARLEIYAITGQRVAVLRQGYQPAGLHRLHWDGHDGEGSPLASGIYLYRLVTPKGALTRKLMLLR